jgi:hypothetical protein
VTSGIHNIDNPTSHSLVPSTASNRSKAFGFFFARAPESITPPRSFSMNKHGSGL